MWNESYTEIFNTWFISHFISSTDEQRIVYWTKKYLSNKITLIICHSWWMWCLLNLRAKILQSQLPAVIACKALLYFSIQCWRVINAENFLRFNCGFLSRFSRKPFPNVTCWTWGEAYISVSVACLQVLTVVNQSAKNNARGTKMPNKK